MFRYINKLVKEISNIKAYQLVKQVLEVTFEITAIVSALE